MSGIDTIKYYYVLQRMVLGRSVMSSAVPETT